MKKHFLFYFLLLGLFGAAQSQFFSPTGTNQFYNVTSDGTVTITGTGGSGGELTDDNGGGSGAKVSATFTVKSGDRLIVVVGRNGNGGDGGGGSAVLLERTGAQNAILLVAGGGGGGAYGNPTNSQGSGGSSILTAAAGGGSAKAGSGGGGFGDDGKGFNPGKMGTLQGGGSGNTGSTRFGFGFGGGGGYNGDGSASTGGAGGGGGYRGGDGASVDNGGFGGTSYVSPGYSVTGVTAQDGVKGGGIGKSGSVQINFVAFKPTLGTPMVTNVTCFGGSDGSITVTATNGTPPYTFSLSPAAGIQSSAGNFTNLTAGNYTLTVTDAKQKTDSKEVQVTQPTAVTFTTMKQDVKCFGGSDGSITITASGGTGALQYSKDGGTTYGTSPNFTNLGAGNYAIRVKDASNCTTESRTVTVGQPAAPLSVTTGPDKSVIRGFGGPNSTCTDLSANASGGTPGANPNYTYVWIPGGQTGPQITVCPETTTTYTVTATDANGCTAMATQKVKVQDVRCGPGNKNVSICYYGVTQCVSENIAARYLKLGATLGGCGSSNNARIGAEEVTNAPLQLALKAYPNPVADLTTLEVLAPRAGEATIEVLDLTGRARQTRRATLVEGLNEIELRLGSLPTGLYLIRAVDAAGRQGVTKVSKQ